MTMLTYCSNIKAELSHTSFFGLDDPSSTDKNGRKELDLETSFCTGQHCGSLRTSTIKLMIWGLVISTFVVGWIVDEYPGWFMVYVSNWTSVYLSIYMTLSLVLSFLERPSIQMIRAAWAMYNISATHGLMVIILFWPPRQANPEYFPPLTYTIAMSHGLTTLLVMIDGLFVNHVPVRLNHYIFILILGFIYLMWCILQVVLKIENPIPDLESIYSLFDWGNNPGQAAKLSAITLFLIMPFLNTCVWGLSLYKRHYVVSCKEEEGVIDSTGRTQALDSGDESQRNKGGASDGEEEVHFVYPTTEEEVSLQPVKQTPTPAVREDNEVVFFDVEAADDETLEDIIIEV